MVSEFRLVKYDAACRALAEARSVDEVKDIIDKTIAMACYARQAKNKNLEADANEIRMRAERRLGELMDEQKETVGFNTGAKGVGFSKTRTREEPPTLAEAGIDKNLAQRARMLGGLSDKEFEEAVKENRAKIADEADRRLGEMMIEQKTTVGLNTGVLRSGVSETSRDDRPGEFRRVI